jgi:putative endopeptidase
MTRRTRAVALACALLGALAPCVPAGAQATACPPGHGLDLTALDTSVRPCDDFYQYANGKWLARTAIPAEYPDWDSFGSVYERNLAIERALVNRAAADKNADPNSPEGKVGSFYRAAADEAQIQADGITPLAPEFARINAIQDVPGLLAAIGHLHRVGVSAGYGFYVAQDSKNSTQEIAHLVQGGFSLPERGYYERTDKETQAIREAFIAHVTKTLSVLGETPKRADADAKTVMALETRLALASKTPTALRDPQANYHKMTLADLDKLTPTVSWQPYFAALGLGDPGGIDVGQPQFFTETGRMLTTVPLADWKTYLRWQLVDTEAGHLSKPFDLQHFAFYGTMLNGIKQQQPRWKRALNATNGAVARRWGSSMWRRRSRPRPRRAP